MSAESYPITPARFAAALPDLPLSSLYAKRAEIENSVAHLEISNQELQSYADEGDTVCKEAIEENMEVITRMSERIGLIKIEVENRGFNWNEHPKLSNGDAKDDQAQTTVTPSEVTEEQNTEIEQSREGTSSSTSRVATALADRQRGRISDEELARLLAQRMEEDEGLHL